MSYDHTKRVWQDTQLKGGKLLVMLALAHHADEKGECYPGLPVLAEKARLTDRQVRRVLNVLEKSGHIVIEQRAIGRSKKPLYRLFPDLKADKMSQSTEESGQNVTEESGKADILSQESGHFDTVKADISAPNQSYAQSESHLGTPIEEQDEDDTQARDPLALAWRQAYGDTIPDHLTEPLVKLVLERGMAATIHGIKAGAKSDSRNFSYIAKCARNYIPPSLSNGNGTGSYQVDLPDADEFNPTIHPIQHLPYVPNPPPPPDDDPWPALLAELGPTLPGVAQSYLARSSLEAAGDVDGVPLYRVIVEERAAAGITWLTTQAGPAIRRKLGSVLGRAVLVEIVALATEGAATQ